MQRGGTIYLLCPERKQAGGSFNHVNSLPPVFLRHNTGFYFPKHCDFATSSFRSIFSVAVVVQTNVYVQNLNMVQCGGGANVMLKRNISQLFVCRAVSCSESFTRVRIVRSLGVLKDAQSERESVCLSVCGPHGKDKSPLTEECFFYVFESFQTLFFSMLCFYFGLALKQKALGCHLVSRVDRKSSSFSLVHATLMLFLSFLF